MDTTQRNERAIRRQLRQRIEWGRLAMLVIIFASLVNQILLWCGAKYHLIFSAALPYYLNWLAGQLDSTVFKVLATMLTLLLYCAYAICWLMSGHRRDWMLATIGLYGVDTLLLIIFSFVLLTNPISCLLEILVHGAVLALLILALLSAQKLSKMPRLRRPAPSQQSDSAE